MYCPAGYTTEILKRFQLVAVSEKIFGCFLVAPYINCGRHRIDPASHSTSDDYGGPIVMPDPSCGDLLFNFLDLKLCATGTPALILGPAVAVVLLALAWRIGGR